MVLRRNLCEMVRDSNKICRTVLAMLHILCWGTLIVPSLHYRAVARNVLNRLRGVKKPNVLLEVCHRYMSDTILKIHDMLKVGVVLIINDGLVSHGQ